MDTTETEQPHGSEMGSPRDYSERMYRFYLELADCCGKVRQMIEEFLPKQYAAKILKHDYGFELEMPIQCAPDLVRLLSSHNIAIYQLVRLSRSKNQWRPPSPLKM